VLSISTRPKLREPEVELLDANGRPIAFTRRSVAAPNPRGQQTYNSHPAIGLTTEILLSYYRSAEYGAPVRQLDMFEDLRERDGELAGMLDERVEDVAGWDYEVIPPPGRNDKPSVLAAGALNEHLQSKLEFRQFLAHQLEAVYYGFSCTNLMWDYEDGLVVPIKFFNVAHRRFGSPSQERSDEIWLLDGDKSTFGLIELEQGLWAISRARGRNPFASGLGRKTSWWTMFKLQGVKQFQVWLDMYGLPLAIGYYQEGAGDASRNALEDAVRSIGQDGYAVLSAQTELIIKETTHGGDSSIHQQWVKMCDAINTKLVTGGTLNTDVSSTGAGSYNAATVHKGRLDAKKRHDARLFEEMFARDIGQTFNIWNGFDRAAPPRVKIKIPWGDLQLAQTYEIIGSAVPLSKSQIYENFQLRPPTDPSDAVRFEPTKPPDPGKARPDREGK